MWLVAVLLDNAGLVTQNDSWVSLDWKKGFPGHIKNILLGKKQWSLKNGLIFSLKSHVFETAALGKVRF